MKILLAVDGSKNAMNAVQCLIQHASWYREEPEVELVTVHPPVPNVRGLNKFVGRRELKRYYDEEGQANLEKASNALGRAGVAFTSRVLVGPIAESLERHARETGCDMIMLGTRGMSAGANALLGSISTKLMHIAKLPVMLVR
jgi:nucleotide-binding universal stress UspA family protein